MGFLRFHPVPRSRAGHVVLAHCEGVWLVGRAANLPIRRVARLIEMVMTLVAEHCQTTGSRVLDAGASDEQRREES